MAIQHTQSEAWRRGYEWADNSQGRGIDEVMDAFGYEIDMPEFVEFLNGVEFRQNEQLGDQFGYDYLDEEPTP